MKKFYLSILLLLGVSTLVFAQPKADYQLEVVGMTSGKVQFVPDFTATVSAPQGPVITIVVPGGFGATMTHTSITGTWDLSFATGSNGMDYVTFFHSSNLTTFSTTAGQPVDLVEFSLDCDPISNSFSLMDNTDTERPGGNIINSFPAIVGGVPYPDLYNTNVGNPIQCPLPIELNEFRGAQNDCERVNLYWQTASETNNEFFFIERRLETEEGFNEVGKIAGAINSSFSTNYNFEDEIPESLEKGSVYYRLKQVDLNGLFKFTDLIEVQYDRCDKVVNEVALYPNPVSEDLNLVLPNHWSGQDLEIEFYNEQNVLVQVERILDFSRQKLNFDMQQLPAGMYFVKIKNKDEVVSKKFIRVH